MSVQPRNDGRAVARAYRIVTGRSPSTPGSANAVAGRTGPDSTSPAPFSETPRQPGGPFGVPGQDSGAPDRRDNVIVGHWLRDGQMSVHAPGQPCALCASADARAPAPGRHRRAARN